MKPIVDKLAKRANYGSARSADKVKYIVIHYTANDGDSAKGNANYFATNIVKASAHYFVDDNYIFFSRLSAFAEMNYIPWLPMYIPCEEDHLIHLFSMLRSL